MREEVQEGFSLVRHPQEMTGAGSVEGIDWSPGFCEKSGNVRLKEG
jgi:hypothetical protein